MASGVTVRAPSSTANLGPGFDVFGLAMNAFYDEITMTKAAQDSVTVTADGGVPSDPDANTAGLVAQNMKDSFGTAEGIDIRIKKGVPAGLGMGSSGASAAAAAVAFDRLFKLNLKVHDLVRFAGYGENASAGTVHYDNVAASVAGGFVVVRQEPFGVAHMQPPADIRLCLAIPKIKVPKKKTAVSRSVIPERIRFADSVLNMSNSAMLIMGFHAGDARMIGTSAKDVIVEPARRSMIPGFEAVRCNALEGGAYGVTISGAGPTVIAFGDDSSDMGSIRRGMSEGFASAGVECRTVVCRPTRGAGEIDGGRTVPSRASGLADPE